MANSNIWRIFIAEIETLKNNQREMHEMKETINQIKTTPETIINRLDHIEDCISWMNYEIETITKKCMYSMKK